MKKYKMDLHIHTPASKCYKGQKIDAEYFEILKSAKEQNLDIIAITDHNTVSGYERFMQLKDEVIKKSSFLEAYQNESYRMKEEYVDLIEKKNIFENILILPGVEITLNPGVHILVIGNVNQVDLLSDILTDVGYSLDNRGSDNDNVIDVDILNFLKNKKLEGLIVSAPHIDSKSGIYTEMDGHYRSAVMKDKIITSFSINSEKQKENIIRMITSDPEYSREKLPAFINCSDAHEASAVGNKYSFVELEEKSYNEIFALFENPEERITDTNDDGLSHLIKNLVENEDTLLIDKPDDNIEDIAKLLCASLNEDVPILIFGTDNNMRLVGVRNSDNDFEDKIVGALSKISSSAISIEYSIKNYKLGNGKYVFILFFRQTERYLWYIKEEKTVYHLNNNSPIVSTIEDIERIVYQNALNDLFDMENKDEERLSRANIQLNSIRSRTNKVLTLKQICEGSLSILHYCDVELCDASVLSADDIGVIPVNGSKNGNVFYIFKNSIRLTDAILRFTCPTALLANELIEKVTIYDVKKDSIVIVRGGGTHYIGKDGKIFGVNEDFIILSPKAGEKLDMKLLLAWMKSSLFTWYVGRKFDTTDIFLPSVLTNAVFPHKKVVESQEVINIVDRIINLEMVFLDKFAEIEDGGIATVCLDEDDVGLLVEHHNNRIAMEMRELDYYFFETFDVEKEGEQWISADLDADGVYDLLQEMLICEE